jgi:hypothetical protein
MSNVNASNPTSHDQNANAPVTNTPVVTNTGTVSDAQRPLNPGLYAPDPAAPPPRDLTLSEIAAELMDPPLDMHYPQGKVTLNITWAVAKAGKERFERTSLNHRHSLSQDDDLYVRGISLGLSTEVLQWLRYGEEELELDASHFQ